MMADCVNEVSLGCGQAFGTTQSVFKTRSPAEMVRDRGAGPASMPDAYHLFAASRWISWRHCGARHDD